MDDEDDEVILLLVKRASAALAGRDEDDASAALQEILGELQGDLLCDRAAQLSLAVRGQLLGASSGEWLTRLLMKGPQALAEVVEGILNALAGAEAAAAECDSNSIPISIGTETFRLARSHSKDPDWSMIDGRTAYAGSRVLARMALSNHIDVRGRRVLELGCGLGLAGFGCARAGAKEVVCSDYDDGLLQAVESSARLNGCPDVVRAIRLDWSDVLSKPQLGEVFGSDDSFDIIVGAEIVYEDAHATMVFAVIQKLIREGFAREAFLSSALAKYRDGVTAFANLLGVSEERVTATGRDAGLCPGDVPMRWTVEWAQGVRPGRDYWVYHLESTGDSTTDPRADKTA